MLVLVVAGSCPAPRSQASAAGRSITCPPVWAWRTSVVWASRPSNNDTEADAIQGCCARAVQTRDITLQCQARRRYARGSGLVNERDPATGAARFDLATKSGREHAYRHALDQYVAKYGTQALSTPQSSMSWLFPSLGVIGGLGLLFVAGRRFIGRSKEEAAAEVPPTAPADDVYADKLDDELAKTDD